MLEQQATRSWQGASTPIGDPDAVSNLRQELLEFELEWQCKPLEGKMPTKRRNTWNGNLQRAESSLEVALCDQEYYCEETNRKTRFVQDLRTVNQELTVEKDDRKSIRTIFGGFGSSVGRFRTPMFSSYF